MKVDEAPAEDLVVYLPDTRGVEISRWGKGNSKLGPDVWTYSRLPGKVGGTCPGSTEECESICYAKRVGRPVKSVWELNTTFHKELPETLPPGAKIIRIHVSGDFDTCEYICDWIAMATNNPEVRFFGYTRSWRVPELLYDLIRLRNLPNVQLFASMDKTMEQLPKPGWRRAWLEDDHRAATNPFGKGPITLELLQDVNIQNTRTEDGETAYVCPEETGRKPNCQSCRYCIDGKRGDVIFLIH